MIKVIEVFHLAQIRDLNSSVNYTVDVSALSSFPDESSSLSIKLLSGTLK